MFNDKSKLLTGINSKIDFCYYLIYFLDIIFNVGITAVILFFGYTWEIYTIKPVLMPIFSEGLLTVVCK